MDMRNVKSVKSVGAWGEVELWPRCMDAARFGLTIIQKETNAHFRQYRDHAKPDHIYIPRALLGAGSPPVQGEWPTLTATGRIKYREGQEETINSVLQALADRSPYGGILQAVTGAGKTVMAIDIMLKLGLKTLIVVPRTSLVSQWIERIVQYTNLTHDQIGLIQGTSCEIDKPVAIGMIHSLAQKLDTYPERMFSAYGTVIFDETHVVGADTFSQVAPAFNCKYRIGLSATPRRGDGMDPVFYWHIGPIVARFTKLQANPRVRIVPYTGRDTDHGGCVWGGKLNLGRYLNRVAGSHSRTDLVRRIILALHKKDHDILVLSERIAQLRELRELLVREGVDPAKIGFLIGNEKQKDRKIILGTYGSAGMGVDIPRLTALVLATPRADIEQAVGRVLRQGSPVVVDIVDSASSIMKGWAAKRMKFYWKITKDIKSRAA